ncbi:MAG: hypothetical protein IPG82_10210 [Saprospiraceae bacterium]|nr:hypothetical protein [Saprospiraceae bacterium]
MSYRYGFHLGNMGNKRKIQTYWKPSKNIDFRLALMVAQARWSRGLVD